MVYTATFTPTASSTTTGTIDVQLSKFTDAATNSNTAATGAVILVDTVAPTVTLGTSTGVVNSGSTVGLTFTLSESATDFDVSDIDVVGGTISGFAGSGTGYTATFTPDESSTDDGTIDIADGVFTDSFGNDNLVATQATISVDTIVPTVVLTSSVASPTNSGEFTVTATFSEAVTGIDISDFVVGNGTASGFTAVSSTVYTDLVTPTASGAVTIDMAAAA